eukprot:4848924-Pyramimonas_sp.AAC.1
MVRDQKRRMREEEKAENKGEKEAPEEQDEVRKQSFGFLGPQDIELPCCVYIADRQSKLNGVEAQVIDTKTSDEWIYLLADMMDTMELYEARYQVDHADGTLRRSRITGLQYLGKLWETGMKRPLQFNAESSSTTAKHEKIAQAMVTDDPFSKTAQARVQKQMEKKPGRGRGRGTGRGREGRGRGRGGRAGGAAGASHDEGPLPLADRQEPELQGDDGPREDGDSGGGGGKLHDEFDVADDVCNESITSAEELDHAYDDDIPAQLVDPFPPPLEPEPGVEPVVDPPTCDDHTLSIITGGVAKVLDGTEDLSGPSDPADGVGVPGHEEPPPPPPPNHQPWLLLGEPSASGYIHMAGRHIMRIQRGKPAKSVTVNCYRHRSCHLCLTEWACPSDMVLKEWLFSVEATPTGADAAANKKLASEHMNIAKDQWGVKKRKR